MTNQIKRCACLALAAVTLATAVGCSKTPSAQTEAATQPTTAATQAATETTQAAAAATEAAQNALLTQDTHYTMTTKDGLVTIELPGIDWCELESDENTELFSNGNCAIIVNLYRNTDTIPTIATTDNNHALVYNATVSSGAYLLHVIGYAAEQSDFSAICKSINTIQVDLTKVTADMLKHEIVASEYSIREENYTAWVNVNGLNVRADSSGTQSAILANLPKDTQLTVTGTVLKKGSAIGWSRVRLTDGRTGYVATQYLTTYTPSTNSLTKTGGYKTLYTASGSEVALYEYSDGTWRTSSGAIYSVYSSDTWRDNSGNFLYTYKPAAAAVATKTGISFPLYYSDGTYVNIYEYSDGTYRDSYGNYYSKYNAGQWQSSNGTILDLEYTPAATNPYRTGVSFPLYRSNGGVVYVYEYSDDTYRDDSGNYYSKYNAGQWQSSNGEIMGLEPSSAPGGSNAPQTAEPYRTGSSMTLYTQGGSAVTIYSYSDGSWRNDYGMKYTQLYEGTWEDENGQVVEVYEHIFGYPDGEYHP